MANDANGNHYGYAPSGLPQTPHALTHLTHAPGQFSNAGSNLAVQHWAGFNLLNGQNQRLTGAPLALTAETLIALGGDHLAVL